MSKTWFDLLVDSKHRLYVVDDQVLAIVNSIYKSLGDAGASPANATGETVLKKLDDIKVNTLSVLNRLYPPGDAEVFTTTPLAANARFYGQSRDFLNSRLTTMGVMGYADQPSATNGVYIQLSHDGVNWDYQGATTTLSAAGAVSLAQVVTARYARVVWVNGATAQTVFRLGGRYMISGSENPPVSLAPPTDITPVCSVCGKDMTDTSDFFVENGKVYCPKCYANKRWKEVPDKSQWIKSLKAWRRIARGDEFNRAKQHTPDEAENEVS